MPFVTIIIPYKSNLKYLFLALKSVFNQSYKSFKLIIIYDKINKKDLEKIQIFLKKKYFKNINAFIYGKGKKFFNKKLNKKIKYKNFKDLDSALKKIFKIVNEKRLVSQIILFSPCAASFDRFKNFEEGGLYFYNLVKKYLNGKQKINI